MNENNFYTRKYSLKTANLSTKANIYISCMAFSERFHCNSKLRTWASAKLQKKCFEV